MAFILTQPALRRLSPARSPESLEQGLSLVECLVAIAIIALTSAMIIPPLFIASATRMQNQRAEQAFQLAQGEVDRVRALVEQRKHLPAVIPDYTAGTSAATLPSTPPPTGLFNKVRSVNDAENDYEGEQVPSELALPVDTTGDGEPDFMIQSFRSEGRTPSTEPQDGTGRPGEFYMGVRVYGRPAIDQLQSSGALEIEPVSLQFTSGEGNQRTRPLAVLYTQINWSDGNFSLCQFQTSLDTSRPCPQQ